MPCYYPVLGYRARSFNTVRDPKSGKFVSNGKRSIVFRRSEGYADQPMSVPCGTCEGCLYARAASWAVRSCHELDTHKDAIFLTLTYSDDHWPDKGLLCKRDVQLFLKRLRKFRNGKPVRYLACGEYGEKTFRPHYHLLIFGWRPVDAVKFRNSQSGPVFTSHQISRLWKKGLHEFGSVTPASAGYVARYTVKKLFDRGMQGAEFLLSSRRPALGTPWLEKHFAEVYPVDEVRLGGKFYKPPTAYDRWLEVNHPSLYKEVITKRMYEASKEAVRLNTDSYRLPIREGVFKSKIKSLKRSFQ